MAIILDHTSSGNISLKGFAQNLNVYPNLSIENGGVLGYLNGFPIEYPPLPYIKVFKESKHPLNPTTPLIG